MSRRLVPAGYRGTDEQGRHQCLTCWGWKHPALHSCPGVPQVGRTPPPTPQRIQRLRVSGWRMPADTVYVGRPTKWGNPYRPVNGDLAEAAATFEAELRACVVTPYAAPHPLQIRIIAEHVGELAGKDLVCWCPLGQPCHADVLLELANAPLAVTG